MKAQILNIEGKKKGEIETSIFDSKIREDVIQKVVEAEKVKHPSAPFYLAGKQASASGKLSHTRRKWKTAAGKGLARIPRKIFWRRGTQFYWQGATVSSARGGRRSHPPKVLSMIKQKKINKKEYEKAFLSALALTVSKEKIKEKYKTLENKEIKISLPIIIEDKILDLKTKEFFNSLQKILDNLLEIAIQKKSVRAGKGKMRGRKYKKSAGLLLIVGNEENKRILGVDVIPVFELRVSDLASNGPRLTAYTEEAIKDIDNLFSLEKRTSLTKRETKLAKEKIKKEEVKKKVKKTKRKVQKEKRKKKVNAGSPKESSLKKTSEKEGKGKNKKQSKGKLKSQAKENSQKFSGPQKSSISAETGGVLDND